MEASYWIHFMLFFPVWWRMPVWVHYIQNKHINGLIERIYIDTLTEGFKGLSVPLNVIAVFFRRPPKPHLVQKEFCVQSVALGRQHRDSISHSVYIRREITLETLLLATRGSAGRVSKHLIKGFCDSWKRRGFRTHQDLSAEQSVCRFPSARGELHTFLKEKKKTTQRRGGGGDGEGDGGPSEWPTKESLPEIFINHSNFKELIW